MAYHIHIERPSTPISLAEWRGAIEQTEGVRMAESPPAVTNPQTGEVIAFGNAGGDADVFFPDEGAWHRVFRWSRRGKVSFAAPADFTDPFCHLRRMASTLAQRLEASLVGDEGESYD